MSDEPLTAATEVPSASAAYVAALTQGAGWAQSRFYEQHALRVRRVLARILGMDSELPDLIQEVFARAFRSLARYDGDESGLAPWVARVAIYTARENLRRRKRRRLFEFSARAGAPADPPDPVASDNPETSVVMARVFAILDRLPANERIALTLRFFEGMALQEIADASETSLATTKRRIKSGRERFERLASRDILVAGWMSQR